jgi:hypothetical protein
MQLLTDAIKKILPALYSTEETPCADKEIIVRFFNPMGNQSWEIAEGSEQEDGDWLLFGLCDLGFGMAEWGYVTLNELQSVQAGLGLGIERDICVGAESLHPEWRAI